MILDNNILSDVILNSNVLADSSNMFIDIAM